MALLTEVNVGDNVECLFERVRNSRQRLEEDCRLDQNSNRRANQNTCTKVFLETAEGKTGK